MSRRKEVIKVIVIVLIYRIFFWFYRGNDGVECFNIFVFKYLNRNRFWILFVFINVCLTFFNNLFI